MKTRIALLAMILLAAAVQAKSQNSIVLLANSIDFEENADFYGFLTNSGINVIYAGADNFSDYKGEKFIVILGGQNAPEGIGEIVNGLLSEDEKESLLESTTSKKMFTKTNVWEQGQVVRILAGYEKEQTREMADERKDKVVQDSAEYCEADSDCVPSSCCHPSSCVTIAFAPDCAAISCTASCEGPLDCGAGSCGCVSNRCRIVLPKKAAELVCETTADCAKDSYTYKCSGRDVVKQMRNHLCINNVCVEKHSQETVAKCKTSEKCIDGQSWCVRKTAMEAS